MLDIIANTSENSNPGSTVLAPAETLVERPKVSAMAATARDYIAHGIALVPIAPRSKAPRGNGWQRRENCWTKPEQVPNDFAGNIGIAHAYCTPITCALDIDDVQLAHESLAARGIELMELLAADDAVQIVSRAGRAKLLFELPPAMAAFQTINESKRLGFELRCASADGMTVQDVLPPSIHPATGKPYEWKMPQHGEETPVPKLPANLVALMETLRAERGRVSTNGTAGDGTLARDRIEAIDDSELADLRSALQSIDIDAGYQAFVDIGFDLVNLGEVGHELWLETIHRGKEYKPSDDKRWNGFVRTSHSHHRAIFKRARAAGWVAPARTLTAEDRATLQVLDESTRAKMPAMATHAPLVNATRPTTEDSDFVVIELGGFQDRENVRQEFAIDQIAPLREVTLFGGHGGSGKSTLAKTFAAHYAAGRPFGPFQVAGGRCAYVSIEDPPAVNIRRLKSIRKEFSLDASAVARNLVLVDGSQGDGALAREVAQFGVRKLLPTPNLVRVRQQVEGCGLIVIDNLSDAYDGSEIDRVQSRAFIRMLKEVARDNDAAVILLAHIDKASAKYGSQGNSYSGSTAWHNSVRSRLALVEENGVLELRHEKSNLGPRAATLALRFTDRGVLVPATMNDPAAPAPADDDALLRCLADAIVRGEKIGTSRLGAYSTFACAKTLTGFPAGLKARDKFWNALDRLEQSGAIVRDDYLTAHRKPAQRYLVAPNAPNDENTALSAMGALGANPAPNNAGGMGDSIARNRCAQLAQPSPAAASIH